MNKAWEELEAAAAEAFGYLSDMAASDERYQGAKAVTDRLAAALRGVEEARHQGRLQKQPGGRWAIVREGYSPDDITSGEVFRLEVDGKPGLQITRMEHRQPDGYYSVDGYDLKDGLRAVKVR